MFSLDISSLPVAVLGSGFFGFAFIWGWKAGSGREHTLNTFPWQPWRALITPPAAGWRPPDATLRVHCSGDVESRLTSGCSLPLTGPSRGARFGPFLPNMGLYYWAVLFDLTKAFSELPCSLGLFLPTHFPSPSPFMDVRLASWSALPT